MRRLKSGRNFIYDKNLRNFSDLSNEEKEIIFYRRLSILGIHEFVESQKKQTNFIPQKLDVNKK
jgi:hypothetical protein